jgi:hypothetical protein
MIPYVALFGLAAVAALSSVESPAFTRAGRGGWPAYVALAAVIVVFVGLRDEVGADWPRYLFYVDYYGDQSLAALAAYRDPGYVYLNWLAGRLGLGIGFVNTASALLFVAGLFHFLRTLPRPGSALLVAIPYLVVVIAMNYTRQSVAIGIVLVAFVALSRGQFVRFLVWVAVAALFHRTAVIVMPLGVLVTFRNRFVAAGMILVGLALAYRLLNDQVEQLSALYLERGAESGGALLRLVVGLVPSVLFLWFFRSRGRALGPTFRLWRIAALANVVLFLMVFVAPSSTAVDRVGLYFLPVQLFAASAFHYVYFGSRTDGALYTAGLTAVNLAYMIVWFRYADHSDAWLPYSTLLF